MTLALVDYGAGNLRSVANALQYLDCSFELCDSATALKAATRIVLPGVGHFGAAMQELTRRGLAKALAERVRAGVPLLGICLGLQLLFESSEEAPGVSGLEVLAGCVRRLRTKVVPHMGWNHLRFQREHDLTRGLPADNSTAPQTSTPVRLLSLIPLGFVLAFSTETLGAL